MLCLEVGVANPNGASKLHLSPVIPMYERELLSGAVVVRAVCPDGSLYSVTVRMETGGEYAKYGSQVVYIEPRCVVTNQTGVGIVMAQTSHDLVQSALELKATDIDVPLRMQSADDDGADGFLRRAGARVQRRRIVLCLLRTLCEQARIKVMHASLYFLSISRSD